MSQWAHLSICYLENKYLDLRNLRKVDGEHQKFMKGSVNCSDWFFPSRRTANLTCSRKRTLQYLPTYYMLPSIPLFGGFFLKLKSIAFFFFFNTKITIPFMWWFCIWDNFSDIMIICQHWNFLYIFGWYLWHSLLDRSLDYFVSTSGKKRTRCW